MRRKIVLASVLLIMFSTTSFVYKGGLTINGKQLQSTNISPIKKIKVAVIDTGLAEKQWGQNFLCSSGHMDFTGHGIYDSQGHGTNISGLIDQHAKQIFLNYGDSETKLNKVELSYCQVILKFFNKNNSNDNTLFTMVEAIEYAIELNVDIINISGGGITPDNRERIAIKKALDVGIIVVAAAGNNGKQLRSLNNTNEKTTTFYPAQYDERVIVVGNGHSESLRAKTSNFGEDVDLWTDGQKAKSLGINKISELSGTSQSTAIVTGRLVRFLLGK